jgi:hypothetical protein
MAEAVSVELLSRLQPLLSLGREGLRALLPLCRTHCFSRASDPFRAADWGGQVVYLVRGQMLVTMPDGTSRVLVGGHEQGAAPVGRWRQDAAQR